MDISIQKGSMEYIDDCEDALLNSDLGRIYFSGKGSARNAILEGLEQETLYIALANGNCVGFMYYMPKGAFHSFPYLHIISVKEEYRGKGVGGKLIQFLEEMVFEKSNKLFLVVAEFNPDGKRFYEKFGYQQVGVIPSLYRKGITEYLMMKEKKE